MMTARDSFERFNDTWLEHLRHLVAQLTSAPCPPTTPDHNRAIRDLIQKVVDHFADYHRTKSSAADVLTVFAAPWSTSLEHSLHWITGWRPTTLFHLLITESSSLFASRILDILRGVKTGDLGDLSPSQFGRVSELQCETVREENEISEELGEWQEDMGDLLELARSGGGGVAAVLEGGRMERLGRVMEKADELRMKTLRSVVELLTPQQAAEFLIAAAELQFGIRGWGLNQNTTRRHA
uniref:DOG1 domain-containing protein n=1 Tax=Kalanchoe fedtschenkoi TaxID=63787 RepID=A0A7N0RDW4_KALFE